MNAPLTELMSQVYHTAVAAFLASERASFITGQVHLIDGGASVMGPELPHFVSAPKDTYQ
jgi:3-oxoacyl-[acyl-carrier protein] reductase